MANRQKPWTIYFLVTATVLLLIFASLTTAVRPRAVDASRRHRTLQGPERTAGFHRQPHQACLAARPELLFARRLQRGVVGVRQRPQASTAAPALPVQSNTVNSLPPAPRRPRLLHHQQPGGRGRRGGHRQERRQLSLREVRQQDRHPGRLSPGAGPGAVQPELRQPPGGPVRVRKPDAGDRPAGAPDQADDLQPPRRASQRPASIPCRRSTSPRA